MQEVVGEDWRGREPPRLRHVGDIAWGWHIAPGERRVRLWPSAWAWYAAPNWIEVQIAGDDLETELHDEVLEWVEQQSPEPVALDVLDSDRGHLASLERRGYRRIEHEYPLVHLARPLEYIPVPAVPDGYRLRHVEANDVGRRVDVHRAAFHPSRLTVELYESLMRTHPYRPDLDWVVEAPDGTFASYACCWLDAENRVAELEPVGTHPDHARRGLASAACLAAIRAAAEQGARWAIVYARSDEAYPAPRRLYESIGFRVRANVLAVQRPD
jgi:ribosomal protein S18 acetylase RimI-like enzyme